MDAKAYKVGSRIDPDAVLRVFRSVRLTEREQCQNRQRAVQWGEPMTEDATVNGIKVVNAPTRVTQVAQKTGRFYGWLWNERDTLVISPEEHSQHQPVAVWFSTAHGYNRLTVG